jgi:hypothetical protein
MCIDRAQLGARLVAAKSMGEYGAKQFPSVQLS